MTDWQELPLGDHVLAECPRWDPETERLSWVDIVRRQVRYAGLARSEAWGLVGGFTGARPVTAAVPAPHGWWVASGAGVTAVSPGGEALGPEVPLGPGYPAVRTNDMVRDPAGRLLVSLFTEDRTSPCAAVVAVDPDRGTSHTVASPMVTGNGMGFSPDGEWLYVVDTARGTLSRYAYSVKEGRAGAGEVLVRRAEPGRLDGLAVDPSGDVWVAVWDAGCVERYSPHGTLLDVLATPVPRPSAVALAGRRLELLVVTTARPDLTDPAGDLAPAADGRLYACRRPR